MTCEHEDFSAVVEVNRLAASDDDPTIVGYSADVRVECASCGERFVFVGAPVGLLPTKPACSVDGLELRVPLRPQSADPHFGMGLAGFAARVREGETATSN